MPQNWLPWQHPLRYQEKKVGLIICNSIPTIWCKDCENRSSDPEILQLPGNMSAATHEGFRKQEAPIAVSSSSDLVAISCISLSRSSKSTVVNVTLSTDIATDMSETEVEIADSGVTSTLRISSMFTVSGEPYSKRRRRQWITATATSNRLLTVDYVGQDRPRSITCTGHGPLVSTSTVIC